MERQSPFPRITEIKRTLDGREKRFDCALLSHVDSHLVVLFIAPTPMHVHGVELPAGTVTFGHFWTDRPYNAYHWMRPDSGITIGTYVNLAADTGFDGAVLEWLDLVIDVMILPGQPPRVLDEDELPADLTPPLRARIEQARQALFSALQGTAGAPGDGPAAAGLLELLESHRAALWPVVQAGPGGAR